jgi:hypothetical protein
MFLEIKAINIYRMEFLQESDFSYLFTHDLYSPVHNVLDACISIRRASGRGLGPGSREFLGPVKWHSVDRRVPVRHKRNLIALHGQLRCIKELNRPAQAAPPHHYKTY